MRPYILLAILCLFLLTTAALLPMTAAQETTGTEVSDAMCAPVLEAVWTTASDACLAKPAGYICNGGRPPLVEPSGAVSSALSAVGALVEAQQVDMLQTSPFSIENNSTGVAWLRLGEPIAMTALLVGYVAVMDVTPPDFPPWQSMVVVTGSDQSACPNAPQNAFVMQTTVGQSTNVVINGASVALNGTLMVQTRGSETLFLGLSGSARILARGQEREILLGEQVSVPHNAGDYFSPAGAPSIPDFMDNRLVQNLPVALLDRPLLLPQPGYVTTAGLVNVRAEPSTQGALLGQLERGEVLSVLGANPAGDWYHVRLDTGETGWMYADLLVRNVGEIRNVYVATPQPPQRYGVNGTLGRVQAPAGINVRNAPDVSFPQAFTLPDGAEVTLLARSPYSPWVKIQHGDSVGWVALIALNTQVVIEALPIDYDVPPPPAPTRIPGSFGNAFPDPRGGG